MKKAAPKKKIVKKTLKKKIKTPQVSQKEIIKQKKAQFLIYFRELPVLKLAAASVGRDEDSILIWRKRDSEFSDQIEDAKAQWAMVNAKQVKSKEWLLERLMNDHFGEKKKLDLTSGDFPINLVSYKDLKK